MVYTPNPIKPSDIYNSKEQIDCLIRQGYTIIDFRPPMMGEYVIDPNPESYVPIVHVTETICDAAPRFIVLKTSLHYWE